MSFLEPAAQAARIPAGQAGRVVLAFHDVDTGGLADPTAAPTLALVREDGSTVTPPPTVDHDGTGVYSAAVPLVETAAATLLTARWTASLNAVAGQTIDADVEVTGGVLFGLAELRALDLKAAVFPTDQLARVRALAESALEDACGVAFVPRFARDRVSGNHQRGDVAGPLLLPRRRASAIRTVSVDGIALTSDELAELTLDTDTGELHRPGGWTRGVRNIEVAYEHGWPAPPPRVARAALKLAERVLVGDRSDLSDRATSLTNDAGTQLLVVAGVRGMLFDVPECNVVVDAYGYPSLG
jgi:hypothetical protein